MTRPAHAQGRSKYTALFAALNYELIIYAAAMHTKINSYGKRGYTVAHAKRDKKKRRNKRLHNQR
jgi:hypothetical protein